MRKQPDAEYAGYRKAGIRLREDIVPALHPHRTERLVPTLLAVHAFDKAHLVTLAREGTVPLEHCVQMLEAMRRMETEGVLAVRLRVQGGVHGGEQFLIRGLGEDIGGQMNLGRSSGDIGETARRMTIRAYLLDIMTGVNRLRATFLSLARDQIDTVMPGYTHGQIAQPTTLGHWASMWDRVLARGFQRCRELYARNNHSPAGAAIMTGTDFALDRQLTATLLGFDGPAPHTMDAILSPDNTIEFAGVLAATATDLARLADDLMSWSSADSPFLSIPDRFCGTSSIMMQKKNPVWPESAKALAGQAAGVLAEVHISARGASGLSLHELGSADTRLWDVASALAPRLLEAVDLVGHLDIDASRMRDAVSNSWASATDLAALIVRETGSSWRSAHQIVGIVVRWCEDRGIAPNAIGPKIIDEASVEYFGRQSILTDEQVKRAMDASQFVDRRQLIGGPAPSVHGEQLSSFEAELVADQHTEAALRSAVERAEQALEDAIDALGTASL